MNRILLLSTCFLCISSLFSQNQLTSIEYFFDSDPGIGNGIQLPVNTPADSITEFFQIPVTGLTPGVHALFVRVKNQNNRWSLNHQQTFVVINDPSQPIVAAEYFWDNDPGPGNGLPLAVQPMGDSSLIQDQITVPAGLNQGDHSLHIRVLTSGNTWSLFSSQVVTICSSYGPMAGFELQQLGNLIRMDNQSQYADSVFWTFGDGTSDTARNPVHLFADQGEYEVRLIAINDCGADTTFQNIQVGGLEAVLPDRAGKNGFITGRVLGFGFEEDSARIRFSHADTSGVVLEPDTSIWLNDQNIWFTMSLEGARLGSYDVEYWLHDTLAFVLEAGFEVEPIIFPDLTINMSGNAFSRVGNFNTYTLILENHGNVDALMVPIVVEGIPTGSGTIVEEFALIDSRTFGPYQASRQEFINNGGDSTVLDNPRLSIPLDSAGNGGYESLSFFLTRVPPGTHIIEFSAQISVGNTPIPMTAHVLGPFLTYSNLRSDSAAKIGDCLRAFADVVLDFASLVGGDITGCLTSLANTVDAGVALGNAVFGGTGELTGIKDQITEFLGGTAHKETPGFTDAVLGVAGPTMALMDLVVNCGPIALKLANPGAALTAKLVEMAKDGAEAISIVGKGVSGISLINNAVKAQELCFGKNGAVTKFLFAFFSLDPNSKTGPGIPGDHYVNGDRELPYTIQFENVSTATAAAQRVVITDTLDTGVYDLNTFRFLGYGFDTVRIPVVTRSTRFFDLYDLRPGQPNILQIEGSLDTMTGVVQWIFTTLDTTTLQLTTDVFEGFLPPNNTSPEGEGYVSYSIGLKAGLGNGALIENEASIVFDSNAPIITNTWENVLDFTPPQSEVLQPSMMPTDTAFLMSWTGRDNISGIRSYTIFVSADNEAYYPYLKNFEDTSFYFIGVPGVTYKFYSVATDRAGNIELPPGDSLNNPDAVVTITTSIRGPATEPVVGQIYPQPGQKLVTLPVKLPQPAHVTISLYDQLGRLVITPVPDQYMPAGSRQLTFDVSGLPPGVYYYSFQAGDFSAGDVLMIRE